MRKRTFHAIFAQSHAMYKFRVTVISYCMHGCTVYVGLAQTRHNECVEGLPGTCSSPQSLLHTAIMHVSVCAL